MMSNKKLIISAGIIAASLILAVIAWFILPDTLVVQLTISGEAGRTLPKLAGIALPFLISAVSAASFFNTENKKYMLGAVVGLAVAVFVIVINL